MVIDDQVPGDRGDPGAEVAARPAERVEVAQRPQERLRSQILGHLAVAHPAGHEPEHLVDVPVVDQTERLRVTALRPRHQRRHLTDRRSEMGLHRMHPGSTYPRCRHLLLLQVEMPTP